MSAVSVPGRMGSHTSALVASGLKFGSMTTVFTPFARSSAMPRPDCAVCETDGCAPQITITSEALSLTLKNSVDMLSATDCDWLSPTMNTVAQMRGIRHWAAPGSKMLGDPSDTQVVLIWLDE